MCRLHQQHIAGTAAQGRPFRSHAASWLSSISSLELQEILCHSRRYHPSSHGSVETNFVANGNYDCWQLWFVGRRFGFEGNYAAIHQLNHDWNLFGMVKPPSGRADKFLVASQVLGAADHQLHNRFQWLRRGAWIDQKKTRWMPLVGFKKAKKPRNCCGFKSKEVTWCSIRHCGMWCKTHQKSLKGGRMKRKCFKNWRNKKNPRKPMWFRIFSVYSSHLRSLLRLSFSQLHHTWESSGNKNWSCQSFQNGNTPWN